MRTPRILDDQQLLAVNNLQLGTDVALKTLTTHDMPGSLVNLIGIQAMKEHMSILRQLTTINVLSKGQSRHSPNNTK